MIAWVTAAPIEPVDLGGQLRQGVELCPARPPVVAGRPIAREVCISATDHSYSTTRPTIILRPFGPSGALARTFIRCPHLDCRRHQLGRDLAVEAAELLWITTVPAHPPRADDVRQPGLQL
jgi:hypothetical protein